MNNVPVTTEDAWRIAALESCGVLDTPAESAFDDLTALAAMISGQPVALVSLVDETRQWFKSRHGFDASETPREIAFCSVAIQQREPLVVEDATRDPRFCNNPLVTGAPHLRFYCGVPLVTPEGHAIGTLCVVGYAPAELTATQSDGLRRLGDQVMAQLVLRRTNIELGAARQAAERTRAEVRRLSLAKSNFLAMASHEMLTPLNAIVGLSDVLRDRLTDADHRAMCNEIHGSGRHLETLLSGMIDLAVLEAGGVTLAAEELNVADEIDSVFEALRPLAKPKRIPLVKERAPGAPTRLVGDSARLRQVLAHLIDNAIKFTTVGEVRVRWSDATVRDGAPAIRFEIIDTGAGMGTSDVARLYEKFSQQDPATPGLQPGLGLGLAITRLLVSAMGGTVGLDSQTGKGTTFTIIIPQARRRTVTRPQRLEALEAASFFGLRVLVVDDNHVNRMLAARLLGRLGCEAIVACDGSEAIAIDPSRYDFVLMDCQMPVMDGFAATRELRAREAATGQTRRPIVAVTASMLSPERGRCLEAGMDDCASKPLTLELLRTLLERHQPETLLAQG